MTGKDLIILCLIFLVSDCAVASGELRVSGGRAAGLGYTSVTQSDEWSAFNNQAGLAWCKRFSAGVFFENRYLLADLSGKALVITLPAGKGAIGVSFPQSGFSLYSEMNAGISYGMHLTKKFSAGVQLHYFRLHVADGYRDNNVLTCEIGLQFRASEHLWLGLHVVNPVPVKLSAQTNDRLPALMQLGLSWRITEGLHVDAEVEKNLIHKPALKAGVEYRPVKSFFIRMGLLSNPTTLTFGAGLEIGNLQIDLASSYHLVLGYSPQASVVYYFDKKKKKIYK
jgi:hypothetical protein